MGLYELDGLLQVVYSRGFGAVVGRGDEVVDCEFVGLEEGVDVLSVEDFGALGLGEDEVEEEDEADPGVERDPEEDESSP